MATSLIFVYRRWMWRGRSGSFAIRSIAWTRRKCLIFIGRLGFSSCRSPSDGGEASWKNAAIAVRSNRDRTTIALRSSDDCTPSAAESPPDDRRSTRTKIMARSRRDRGPIAARSCRKSSLFRSKIEAHSSRN